LKVISKEGIPPFELFEKVTARVVLDGERMTLIAVEIPENGAVPEHSHPHEQFGILLKGEAEFGGGESIHLVKEGMLYQIPPQERHRVKVTRGPALFLDIFSPPREEYVEMQRRAHGT
jgi:quercetin dioxygenase-like cupin family protein